MADYYELKTKRNDKNGKTYWTKVGVAFPQKNGTGFNIQLEALPLPQMNDNGQVEVFISMMPPFEKNGYAQKDTTSDDHIPF
jgi:hypothetical protein|tara:strand:- start:390 stop:635 length:246 start_codon:yes stop_codon:yes gene_type:complete